MMQVGKKRGLHHPKSSRANSKIEPEKRRRIGKTHKFCLQTSKKRLKNCRL